MRDIGVMGYGMGEEKLGEEKDCVGVKVDRVGGKDRVGRVKGEEIRKR